MAVLPTFRDLMKVVRRLFHDRIESVEFARRSTRGARRRPADEGESPPLRPFAAGPLWITGFFSGNQSVYGFGLWMCHQLVESTYMYLGGSNYSVAERLDGPPGPLAPCLGVIRVPKSNPRFACHPPDLSASFLVRRQLNVQGTESIPISVRMLQV